MNGPYGTVLESDRRDTESVDEDTVVAVHGLGKLGLPVAVVFANAFDEVVGVDTDPATVAAVEEGGCPVENEPGLPKAVADRVAAGALRATTDAVAAAERAAIHVVIVPTEMADGEQVDLSAVEAVTEATAEGLAPGDVMLVESTVPPGTTGGVIAPTLASKSGIADDRFGVAFCPERTSSGRALRDIRGTYPKVVGGVDSESAHVAAAIYRQVTSAAVVTVSDADTAECVKLFEGVYRDVNIALANELATLASDLGVDVTEAIEVANGQPYCDVHEPGPGVGGHCIPWYPYFLMSAVQEPTPLLRVAREVNESMPEYTVGLVRGELEAAGTDPSDARILVLGLTYRPGVAETRESPAIPIIDGLSDLGADVFAADPLVDPAAFGARPVPADRPATADPDVVVLVTPHEGFCRLDWSTFEDVVVVDGRDALDAASVPHRVVTLGG